MHIFLEDVNNNNIGVLVLLNVFINNLNLVIIKITIYI